MASYFPKSALKSPNSPSRSWRTVSFEEQRKRKRLLKNLTDITLSSKAYHSPTQGSPPLSNSERFTSRDKRDYSRELHSTFTTDHGLSIEEITCDEIDDILPKTDYTYARTASYSPRQTQDKYFSPNMSRRRLRSAKPEFLSDDEEEFSSYDHFTSNSRVYSEHGQDEDFEQESSTKESQISGARFQRITKLRGDDVITSTPLDSHDQRHISTNDHYYDGILLRSGSRVKGVKRYNRNQTSSSAESKALLSEVAAKSDVHLNLANRSELDTSSWQHNARNLITVTKTTTTTTTTTNELGNREDQSQRGALTVDDLSERKLRLDESQTEKGFSKDEYKLKHLYGLDSEEEYSDVDDVTKYSLSAKESTHRHHANHVHSHWNSSFFSYITTIITTVVTTVTSTFSDGISSVNKPLAMAASKWIVAPGGWLLMGLADTASWLITRSANFLLWDIDVKQKRRRDCCCCFLPLLFLLPLLLLAGYYTRGVQHNLGAYMSDSKQLLSSSWSYLWLTSSSKQEVPISKQQSPPISSPVTIPLQASVHHPPTPAVQQVDMTQIYQHIQLAVAESAAANKDNRPVGLTTEQVEAIVKSLLANQMNDVTSGLEGQVMAMKSLLQENVASLQYKIAELESEIKANTLTQQTLTDNFNQARTSFEGTSAGQNIQWLAAAKALEQKLLNLTQEVNNLSSQNAAFTAMMTNCCRNNSAITDIVKAHVASVLSQMSTDEDSELAILMTHLGGHYVDKTELDQRLSAISVEIMKNVKIMLAEREQNSNATVEVQTSVIEGVNESTVKTIIEEALTQFSADRVGMPDFALESSGGSVISVRCSETYYKKTALVSVFGIPLWYTSNSPRTVIQPNVNPGECWAFKGQSGFIVFQLSHTIQPTGFTLEHIPRSLAPKGDISSAPKDFAVFGLISEADIQGINLGNYTYLDNGKPIQFFPTENRHPGIFQFVELRILDNHGNKEYTCVYRFRVHGLP